MASAPSTAKIASNRHRKLIVARVPSFWWRACVVGNTCAPPEHDDGGSWRWSEDVADAADGVEEAGLVCLLGLAAEVAHVDVEGLGAGLEVVAPDAVVDDAALEDDVHVDHEQLEEV